MICEYCNSALVESEMNCRHCGAPIVCGGALPDFRFCPLCHRRLVALGSPACNYCGRRLPDEYIRVREADMRRITETEQGDGTGELAGKVDELMRETARQKRGGISSAVGLIDVSSLIDFFS